MINYPCKPDPQPLKEDSPKNTIQPLMLKPPPDMSKFKLTKEPEFLSELISRLSGLNLAEQSKSITTISESRDKLEELIKQLSQNQEDQPSLNKITAKFSQPEMKPYYRRPSPVDLQCEDEIWHGASYDGASIVE